MGVPRQGYVSQRSANAMRPNVFDPHPDESAIHEYHSALVAEKQKRSQSWSFTDRRRIVGVVTA
jgi:hypothetical protein